MQNKDIILKKENFSNTISWEEYIQRCYNCRPTESQLKQENNCILIRGKFPKTIKKDTIIASAFPLISFDAVIEFHILKTILKKPIGICATSGNWEGLPFLLFAMDDIIITLEDEKIIQKYKNKVRLYIPNAE